MITLLKNNSIAGLLILAFVIAVIVLTVLSVRNWAEQLAGDTVPISLADNDMVIAADNPDLCPGDVLMWPVTITYERGGLLMDITRNIRNLDTDRLFAVDGVIYSEHVSVPQEIAGTFNRRAFWRVPLLSPANYRLITSTQAAGASAVLQYYVEFTIRKDCPS